MSAPLAITEDATLRCDHQAKVENKPSQELFRIDGKRVLVARDPEDRHIHGCPNLSPATKPCTMTLVVEEGYSTLLAVSGAAVCLASIRGHTDGTPPGAVYYTVKEPGQNYVTVAS